MSNIFQIPLTPAQARAYVEGGLDFVSGLAVDAEAAEHVHDVADLIELFQIGIEGGPFQPDQPIFMLRLPTGPLIQARRAVGPLDDNAFLGGVFEVVPFKGNGMAATAGVETPLYWIEPGRLTAGAQIWKFEPGEDEPIPYGVYHGLAYGWESIEHGTFKAVPPSNLIGTTIKRSWGDVPCDVELDDDGHPASLTMVSPINPPKEEGFAELESGMWAKRIAFPEPELVSEQQIIGRVNGVPVRVVRPMKDKDESIVFQVASLLPDAPYCLAKGFKRQAPAVFVKNVKQEEISNQVNRRATVKNWVVPQIRVMASADMKKRNLRNNQSVMSDVFKLLVNCAPTGWETMRVILQLVDTTFVYAAAATVATGDNVRIPHVPTALVHYARQLKSNTATTTDGAYFSCVLDLQKSGRGTFGVNKTSLPPWADKVELEHWKNELANYPRTAANTPDWLVDILAGRTPEGMVKPGASGESSDNDEPDVAVEDADSSFEDPQN